MLDRISQLAIQSLGVDVANLSSRLAVSEATISEIVNLGFALDPPSWTHAPVMDSDGKGVGHAVTMSGEEAEKLQRLLSLLGKLVEEPV